MLSGNHQPDNLPEGGLPLVAGYSNVGRIEAVGSTVDDELVGQRVASPTEHARYLTITPDACVPVPDDISSITASFFRIGQISMNAIRRGKLGWGESIAVRGLGVVGQMVAQTALVAGATPVYAIDLVTNRVDALPTHERLRPVHLANDRNVPAERHVDIVVDTRGNHDTLSAGISFLRKNGRLIIVGCPRQTVPFDFYRDCIVPSAHIIGSYRVGVGEDNWVPKDYVELFFGTSKAVNSRPKN